MRDAPAKDWVFRIALILVWAGVLWAVVDWPALGSPTPELLPYAALQMLALVAYALTVLFTLLARKRTDLIAPSCLLALALALHSGAAATQVYGNAASLAVIPATGEEAPWLTAAAAAAGAALLGLLVAHTRALFPPTGPAIPLRARLRSLARSPELNPGRLFFGPVFQREVRVAGRRRSTYVARAVYAALLMTVAGIAYYGMTREMQNIGGAERIQRLQELAPQLGLIIGWSQLLLLSFLAPTLTAPAICDERRTLTLPALMTTPMSAAQIVFGKLTSRMVLILLLALIPAPLLLAVRIFGGLDAEPVIAMTAISLSFALLAASMGLLYSVWHTRAATAAIFAMLTLGLLVLASGVAVGLVWARVAGGPPDWLFAIASPVAMAKVTEYVAAPGMATAMAAVPGNPANPLRALWMTNVGVNLALTAVICLSATAVLRSILRAELAGETKAAPARPSRRKRRAAAPAAPDAPPADESATPALQSPAPPGDEADPAETTRAARTVGDRPVLWREIRQGTFGKQRMFWIIAGVIVLTMLWMYWWFSLAEESVHFMVGIAAAFVILLQASLATTGAVAAEREARTWDILLTTALTPGEIVAGKVLGGLRRLWFPFACLAVHLALSIAAGYMHSLGALHMALILLPPAFCLVSLGLLLSLLFRRTTAASVANMSAALAVCVGLPMAFIFVFTSFGMEPRRGTTLSYAFDAVLFINPVATTVMAIEGTTTTQAHSFGGLRFDMPSHEYSAWGYTAALAGAAVFYTLVGAAALFAARKLLRRSAGKGA